MRKMLCVGLISTALFSAPLSANQNIDKASLAGSYKCTANDSHDGLVEGTVTFTLDESASAPDQNFAAYNFTSKNYSGFIAAQGNAYAYYFENSDRKNPKSVTDRGVGIATVTYDQDSAGKFKTTLHGFYFEPEYMRDAKDGKGAGGRGTSLCVKLD